MPVPRRRHSKRRSAARRTHEKLKAVGVGRCAKCDAPKLPHRVCPSCGTYRGREYRATVTK